jgi:hypothetical protein
MVLTNIDSIVRRWLLESGRPIHYYAEGLYHAATCLRELTLDTLQIVNTVRLPVNDYAAADLPEDFVDEVMVGVMAGNFIQPIPKGMSMNPLRLSDSQTGDYINNEEVIDGTRVGIQGAPPVIWYYNNNEYNEPTGKLFGFNGGARQNLYDIDRRRRQIILSDFFLGQSVILQYISDGQSTDAASQIDVRAFSTIQAYIEWKRSRNANNGQSPEADLYYNERRILRARLNDLTTADIKQIVRQNFHASIKN